MASTVLSRVVGLGALTAAGQLLIIGTLPAYSRVFDPGAYGKYVIFVGAFTVMSVLAGVRYDSAIVLPRNNGIAAALSGLVVVIGLGVSALIAVATLTADRFQPSGGGWSEYGFGYCLALATAVGALQRCLSAWCVRDARFLRIGWGQFVFCLATMIAQLSFAAFLPQLPALLWGYVCALVCQALCLGRPSALAWKSGVLSWRAMAVVARKYRRFPLYMVGYALASSARDRLIQVVLGLGAGPAAVGRFGLAYRVAFAPNSLIYSAVSPVFFGIASRGSRLDVGRFAAGLVEAVFVALIVPYTAFAVEAPVLTDAVLSEKWHGTGPYLQALAGPALLLAATCWLDRAFDSFRRQNAAFSLEGSFTVIVVAVVAFLAPRIQPVAVAWTFGTLALVYYWIYFLVTFVACGFPMQDFRRAVRNGLIISCIVLSGALAVHAVEQLLVRFIVYFALMSGVALIWFKWLGGAATIRALLSSRLSAR